MRAEQSGGQAEKPAAYDAEGRPLYYHPASPVPSGEAQMSPEAAEQIERHTHVTSKPGIIDGHNFNPRLRTQYANEQKIVHVARSIDPAHLEISDELRNKHERSVDMYPQLNLSTGEYVILDIKRHPIGMIAPISISLSLLVAIFLFVSLYSSLYNSSVGMLMADPATLLVIALLMSLLSILGGAVALWVYLQNQFFMTNESVIQQIQESPFSRHEQTVSLGSIEDASFRQAGILQTVLDYGTIRLSTEGEETTYFFRFVAHPKRQISRLNNAIEAFKNGRPVPDD